jgi:hypothetical protein
VTLNVCRTLGRLAAYRNGAAARLGGRKIILDVLWQQAFNDDTCAPQTTGSTPGIEAAEVLSHSTKEQLSKGWFQA